MKMYIFLLVALIFNRYTVVYSQSVTSNAIDLLSSTTQIKESAQSLVGRELSSICGDVCAESVVLLDNHDVMGGDYTLFFILLFLFILLGLFTIRLKKRLNKTASNLVKVNNQLDDNVEEVDTLLKTLSETKHNLSLAVEVGDMSVWGYDVASESFYNIQGVMFEDGVISFQDRLALVHPDDVDQLIKVGERLVNCEILEATTSFRFKDSSINEYRWIKNNMSVVLSKDGRVVTIVGVERDVTSEILQKQKVEETMLYLKLSIQSTDMSIWYIEEDCIYLFKNGGFVKTGYLLSSLFNYIHPEDKDKYNAFLLGSDNSNCIGESEIFRFYDEQSGDYNYLECSFRAVKYENGNIYRIVGGHYDITKKKREDIHINNVRKVLDMSMQASNILAWEENLSTSKIEVIYGSIKGLHYISGSCRSFIHPKDIDLYKNYNSRIINGAIIEEPIFINIKKGDGYGYFECILSLIYNEKGEKTHLIGSLKDLTEINNLNETLNNLYNESQILFQSLPVAIAVYGKDGRQQYVNDSLKEIFGIRNLEDHLNRAVNLFDDPVLTPYDIDIIKRGENRDRVLKYDLKKVSDLGYFSTYKSGAIYIDSKLRCIKNSNGEIVKYLYILNDITEKHKYELALESSRHNLKLAVDVGNIEAWLYDLKSKRFYCLGGDSFFKGGLTLSIDDILIHPDDFDQRTKMMKDITRGIVNKSRATLRYRASLNDDTYRYYDTYMAARKKNGITVAITFVLKDITDEYLYDIEREESRRKIEFAMDSADLVFWEYDVLKQEFVSYNDSIVGLDSADPVSIDDYCKYLNADEDSENQIRDIISHMNEGIDESYSIDIRINTESTNGYKYVYCTVGSSTFEKNEEGKVVRYVGYRKDNTKLVALNDMLIERNTQLKTILDIGDILPFICEIKGNRFHVIAPYHKDYALFADSEKGILVEQLLSFFHPDVRESIKSTLIDIMDGSVSKVHEEIVRNTEDMNNKIFEINLYVVRNEGLNKSVKLIGYMQNITQRKQLMLDLEEAKQEAERSVKLKSAFLANMSHEIRTPLNAIIGFSELLVNEVDNGKKLEYLGIISTNNDLLLKLINDILDLSKIDAGYIEINASLFDFSHFFNELYQSMQHRITSSAITLSVINPYDKCIVKLDKNRVAQVCINYITNAIKYTIRGHVKMGYECINGGVKIYVEDSGIGIADDKKHKVFQRFEKFDDFAQGTGLGLSITKALIESMGGDIGFESQEYVGSTFWAWIPCDSISVLEKGEVDSHLEDGKEIKSLDVCLPDNPLVAKVLVSENDDSSYVFISDMLCEHSLHRVINGEETINMVREDNYDAIFIDVDAQALGGVKSILEIRSFNSVIPIIAIGTVGISKNKHDAIKAGANYFMKKPIKNSEMRGVMRYVIREKRCENMAEF